MECVPFEIVQLVGSEIPVGDPVRQRLPSREHCGNHLRFDAAGADGGFHFPKAFLAALMVALVEDGFDLMRTGAVADVMEKREDLEMPGRLCVQPLQLRGKARAPQDSDRMLEPGVPGAWEDDVVEAKLLATAQALEERMLDNRQKVADFDRTYAWYADSFHPWKRQRTALLEESVYLASLHIHVNPPEGRI